MEKFTKKCRAVYLLYQWHLRDQQWNCSKHLAGVLWFCLWHDGNPSFPDECWKFAVWIFDCCPYSKIGDEKDSGYLDLRVWNRISGYGYDHLDGCADTGIFPFGNRQRVRDQHLYDSGGRQFPKQGRRHEPDAWLLCAGGASLPVFY